MSGRADSPVDDFFQEIEYDGEDDVEDEDEDEQEIAAIVGDAMPEVVHNVEKMLNMADLLTLYRQQYGYKDEQGKDVEDEPELEDLLEFAKELEGYEKEGIDDQRVKQSLAGIRAAVAADVVLEPHLVVSSSRVKGIESNVLEKINQVLYLRTPVESFLAEMRAIKQEWRTLKIEELNADPALLVENAEEDVMNAIDIDDNILESMRLNAEAHAFRITAEDSTLNGLDRFVQARDEYQELMHETIPSMLKGVRNGTVSKSDYADVLQRVRHLRWKVDGMREGLEQHGLKKLQAQMLGYQRKMKRLNKEEQTEAKAFIKRVKDFLQEIEEEDEELEQEVYNAARITVFHDQMGAGYLPDNWEIVLDPQAQQGDNMFYYRNMDTGETSARPPHLVAVGHEHGDDIRRPKVSIDTVALRLRNLHGEVDEDLFEKENWKALDVVKKEVSRLALDLTYLWFNNRQSDDAYAREILFMVRRMSYLNGNVDYDNLVVADEIDLDEFDPVYAKELRDEKAIATDAALQKMDLPLHQYEGIITSPACDLQNYRIVGDQFYFPCTEEPEKGTYPRLACSYYKNNLMCWREWVPPSSAQYAKRRLRRATGKRPLHSQKRRRRTGKRR